MGKRAKAASREIAALGTMGKNKVLLDIADELLKNAGNIIESNKKDLEEGRKNGLSAHLLDRLMLDEKRIEAIAEGVRSVERLPDPVGEVESMKVRPNGLKIGAKRVPLGVIGIIYEARPNVTVDAAVLCLKSGNAAILRGGKEAFYSNIALCDVMRSALEKNGLDPDILQLVPDTSRETAVKMMKLSGYLDVLIPRGSAGLIRSVVENATVPAIETGIGNCHVYIDKDADLEMAANILYNAKCSRPSVCNAAESMLVHKDVAEKFLPMARKKLDEKNVEIRGCEKTCEILKDGAVKASEEDFYTEFYDYIISCKVVSSFDEAVAHITKYGTGHSEAIVTENYTSAQRFLDEIDAAAVYVNASTRFTDGFEFGFGAEIGISTQKLHARGPMGLREMTTVKYIVYGNGQVR